MSADQLFMNCRKCILEERQANELDVVLFEGNTLFVLCRFHGEPVLIQPYSGPTAHCDSCAIEEK